MRQQTVCSNLSETVLVSTSDLFADLQAIKVLEAQFSPSTRPAYCDRAASLLLEFLLPSAAAGKVPATALRVASGLQHPFLLGETAIFLPGDISHLCLMKPSLHAHSALGQTKCKLPALSSRHDLHCLVPANDVQMINNC